MSKIIIERISSDKKRHLDLLLLGDEQEDMIDRYLDRGEMFALFDGDLKSVCVVTSESDDLIELKNIATYKKYQGQGYGTRLIEYICDYYSDSYKTVQLGTGECYRILSFYQARGFSLSHRINNFFIDNYDHPIYEDGIRLTDMVYLRKELVPSSIVICGDTDYEELTLLWEASVRSSHHFLSEKDILFYKPLVREQYLASVQLYAIRSGRHNPAKAFIGLSGKMIEMLFVHPDFQGKGYGKRLIEFAIREKNCNEVDVNEQNEKALRFYEDRGFRVYGRDDTDSTGNPFPIMHMRISREDTPLR